MPSSPTRGPDFLGIGPSRCGTTTLFAELRSHPGVWLPPLKELHYWDRQRGRARWNRKALGHATWLRHSLRAGLRREPGATDDLRFFARYLTGARTDEWYRSLFAIGGPRASGEITPAYCSLPDATLDALARALPDTRFVLVLRDPIERAWSSAAKSLARARDRSIDGVDDDVLARHFARPGFRHKSDYMGMLDRWQRAAGQDRLHVGFFDDLVGDPGRFFGELATFLDIDPSPLPSSVGLQARNTTSAFRSAVPARWERRLAEQFADEVQALEERLGGPVVRWNERIRQALRSQDA
ncbi:MAG: sulfotransferase [Acidimicrobiales bacterium]|nr:sulfotransferase [Acidimicrobiales bacterium]